MHVDITLRGSIPDQVVEKARKEEGALDRVVKGPLTDARIVLTQEKNPRIEFPARAEGEVLLAGRPVRARVDCPTMVASCRPRVSIASPMSAPWRSMVCEPSGPISEAP